MKLNIDVEFVLEVTFAYDGINCPVDQLGFVPAHPKSRCRSISTAELMNKAWHVINIFIELILLHYTRPNSYLLGGNTD